MWRGLDVSQVVADAIALEEAALRREQSVLGLDARSEVELHGLIERAFSPCNVGVQREVPYPSLTPRQRKLPDRLRSDFVLTPARGQAVRDELHSKRRKERAAGTLFESAEEAESPDSVPPGECLWLEVKCVAQFAYTSGVPGPNRQYSSELVGSLRRDLSKLASDPLIEHGALLLVLFTASKEIAEHDLAAAANRVLNRGAHLKATRWVHTPILDRAGNALASAAVFESESHRE